MIKGEGIKYNLIRTLLLILPSFQLEITEKKAENQELMEKLSEVKQDNSFMLSYCKAHGIEIPGIFFYHFFEHQHHLYFIEVLKARVESSQVDENDNEN